MELVKFAFWRYCPANKRDRQNQFRVLGWMLAWTVSWLGVGAFMKQGWLSSEAVKIAAILLPIGIGVGLLFAYRRYLSQAGESLRKIELEAMALALGVGLIGGATYWLLDQAGMIADIDIFNGALLLVSGAYVVGVMLGRARHA